MWSHAFLTISVWECSQICIAACPIRGCFFIQFLQEFKCRQFLQADAAQCCCILKLIAFYCEWQHTDRSKMADALTCLEQSNVASTYTYTYDCSYHISKCSVTCLHLYFMLMIFDWIAGITDEMGIKLSLGVYRCLKQSSLGSRMIKMCVRNTWLIWWNMFACLFFPENTSYRYMCVHEQCISEYLLWCSLIVI